VFLKILLVCFALVLILALLFQEPAIRILQLLLVFAFIAVLPYIVLRIAVISSRYLIRSQRRNLDSRGKASLEWFEAQLEMLEPQIEEWENLWNRKRKPSDGDEGT